jgi:hypothetical protein
MIKRPLHPRFNQAVLEGRKITTIRDKPWPIGVPIMTYNWSGPPYRSKQIDVAPIIVENAWPIHIMHRSHGGVTYFDVPDIDGRLLWDHEGFGSSEELNAWFRAEVKLGQTVPKFLMKFHLEPNDQAVP